MNKVHFDLRKFAHIGFFLVLGILACGASISTFGFENIKREALSVIVALTVSCGYGFIDEWHKQFIDGRHFDTSETILDIISAAVGVLIFTGVYFLALKIIRKYKVNNLV